MPRRVVPVRKPYPWPASRIDREVMHELHSASLATGHPITVLIAEAVHAAMTQRLDAASAAASAHHGIGFSLPAPAPAGTGVVAA